MSLELSKEEFKKKIIEYFEENSKLTIDEAISKIKETLIIDRHGNTQNESMKIDNVRLFYTNNSNYAGGAKNGYGTGWYLTSNSLANNSTIKLRPSL